MACLFYSGRREWQRTRERTEEVIRLSTEQGFPDWLAYGKVLRGRILVAQGQVEEGIVQMQQGLAYSRATGSEVGRILHLPWLAAAYARAGRVKEALAVLIEAQTLVDTTGARVGEAGLFTQKGWLLLAHSGENHAEAEACFRQAIEIARRQSAKSLELGAVMSLARLWQQQGKKRQAHKMLSDVYNWFTEGFETKDLREAKSLLDSLGSSV